MKKEKAIQKVEEYINAKELDWEAIYHIDKEPEENSTYWIFKNLWEPRDPRRGDQIQINWTHPRILVHKENATIKEVSAKDMTSFDNSQM